ncbi:trypsin-like peptidase domain-containing protein [Archangium primigenium]|uniref:trypsin-like peptidase domain-containing protein n=1 Tax=[Archangium] primigenium TaxID=2792470 RepID=UPI00195A9BCC|nr:trypsin-like peptidase domain-containing protein [Archangium primigenium]MBM7115698.1 trypsin-like peptidase domain-containing protein [Archangium primigenium]
MDEMNGLLERLERALGGRALHALYPGPRALVGFEAAIASSVDGVLARSAVEKLRAGGRLLASELEALEVGIRLARPALWIERGQLPSNSSLGLDGEARAMLETLLPGVARVGWRWDIPLATAFQVAPRVLVTCVHVAERLLEDTEDLAQGHFVARFDADAHRGESTLSITSVLAHHPEEDVAFLELASDGPLARGLRLARQPWLPRGGKVLGVGYPLYSHGNPPWVNALFENVYGVKRLSPGELLGVEGSRLFHDCTTLSGSSGSPLIDPSTGLVVGIHSSGQFALRNTAVSTRAIHEIARLQELVALWG